MAMNMRFSSPQTGFASAPQARNPAREPGTPESRFLLRRGTRPGSATREMESPGSSSAVGAIAKSTLENGLRVVTEHVPGVRSIAIGVLVDASPRNEKSGQEGLAHLSEHLMFQGTSSRDAAEIARFIDAAGGAIGAFTARDYTCYYATVVDDYRYHALDLLGDILLNSIFPPDKVEAQKHAILCEILGGQDAPDHRAHAWLKAST